MPQCYLALGLARSTDASSQPKSRFPMSIYALATSFPPWGWEVLGPLSLGHPHPLAMTSLTTLCLCCHSYKLVNYAPTNILAFHIVPNFPIGLDFCMKSWSFSICRCNYLACNMFSQSSHISRPIKGIPKCCIGSILYGNPRVVLGCHHSNISLMDGWAFLLVDYKAVEFCKISKGCLQHVQRLPILLCKEENVIHKNKMTYINRSPNL